MEARELSNKSHIKDKDYKPVENVEEKVEEIELGFHRCVNHIVVKPNVSIKVTIEGIESTMV